MSGGNRNQQVPDFFVGDRFEVLAHRVNRPPADERRRRLEDRPDDELQIVAQVELGQPSFDLIDLDRARERVDRLSPTLDMGRLQEPPVGLGELGLTSSAAVAAAKNPASSSVNFASIAFLNASDRSSWSSLAISSHCTGSTDRFTRPDLVVTITT